MSSLKPLLLAAAAVVTSGAVGQAAIERVAGTASTSAPVSTASQSACLARFPAIDLPFQRGDSAAPETIVCHQGYVAGFDPETHDPDWVLEHLTPAVLQGKAVRSNGFRPDPLLNGADAGNADYLKTGFDRGHQAPAGDAKFSQPVMDESFFFSNMAPQVGIGFNRGAWKFLEESVRAWVVCGGHPDIYVITGPIYDPHAKTIGIDKVVVPGRFFKIVYDPQSGRAVGFVLPNKKIGSTIADLQADVHPIAEIETETGLDFFRGLPMRTQVQLEAQPGVAWAHGGACNGDASD